MLNEPIKMPLAWYAWCQTTIESFPQVCKCMQRCMSKQCKSNSEINSPTITLCVLCENFKGDKKRPFFNNNQQWRHLNTQPGAKAHNLPIKNLDKTHGHRAAAEKHHSIPAATTLQHPPPIAHRDPAAIMIASVGGIGGV